MVELNDGAGGGAPNQVVRDLAAGDRFHRDRDATVGPRSVRGQRICPPLAYAVDVHADADVLPGRVGAPPAAGPDEDADGVAGFGVNCDDASAQGGTRAQRIDDVEVVGGD